MINYTLQFPTEQGIEVYNIKTKEKPDIGFKHVDIPHMSEINYQIPYFKPIRITFIEPLNPKKTKILKWINSFYSNPKTGMSNIEFKKNIIISKINKEGIVDETWTLEGCYIDCFEDKPTTIFENLKFTLSFEYDLINFC